MESRDKLFSLILLDYLYNKKKSRNIEKHVLIRPVKLYTKQEKYLSDAQKLNKNDYLYMYIFADKNLVIQMKYRYLNC